MRGRVIPGVILGVLTVLVGGGAAVVTGPTTALGATAATPAGTRVSDGFETQTGGTPSGLWSPVAPDCSGTGTATIDRTVAHTGTASLRIDGGTGYCNHVFAGLNADLTTLGRTIYTRLYLRHATALPDSHVTFAAFNDAADGNKDLRVGGQNKALQWNRALDDATLPEQSPAGVALSTPLPTGSWQCLEVMVNGTSGTADTWLNGTLVAGLHADGVPTTNVDGQWYNKTWRPSPTSLKLGWESYGAGADTLWYDDVVVGPSRIGC
jgi:hypothetical protein